MKADRRTSNEDQAMLDAVFTDKHWQALSECLKRQALVAMAQARQQRQLRMHIGQVTVVMILLGSLAWWFHSPTLKSVVTENVRPNPKVATAATADLQGRYMSEEEMLAMFPTGSCVVAEVDGRKELVFFDVEAARKGFVRGSAP